MNFLDVMISARSHLVTFFAVDVLIYCITCSYIVREHQLFDIISMILLERCQNKICLNSKCGFLGIV